MGSIPDRDYAGRSERVPFIPGEDESQRHERRKEQAQEDKELFKKWCQSQGMRLQIYNNGHHWQVRDIILDKQAAEIEIAGVVAEWWPSSAKLVIKEDYQNGIHCHDVQQVIDELENRL